MDLIRKLSKEVDKPIAILQDLQGPKIRTSRLKNGPVELVDGADFTITTRVVDGDSKCVSTSYMGLPDDLAPGNHVLLDDGIIELEVRSVTETDVNCKVIHGRTLSDNKGINLPGIGVSAPSITEKDKKDLVFGIENDVDYVAISFVRRPEDVAEVKAIIKAKGKDIPVIAKIEKQEAIRNFDAILNIADGIMVARGDLGVEYPLEEVPSLQKRIIRKCNEKSKVVITATQMLESMIQNPRPTRAEASDVANAIFDGTDAVMLSGETAGGKFPVLAVQYMAKIATKAEEDVAADQRYHMEIEKGLTITNSVGHAACHLADNLNADAIITFTEHGFTARMISKYRQPIPVIAVTPFERMQRRMSLYWGVTSVVAQEVDNTDEMIATVEKIAKEKGLLRSGEVAVITAGVPFAITSPTNLIKIHRIE